MADTKFTRGRWVAAQKHSSKAAGLPVVASPHGRSVASVTFFGLGEDFKNHDEESYANAHLISAAPELYEALEAFVAAENDANNPSIGIQAYDKAMKDAFQKAVKALAKARGEAA